jgi:hypothetical protein
VGTQKMVALPRLTDAECVLCVRVRVEMMGSQKCSIVGKSQPFLL